MKIARIGLACISAALACGCRTHDESGRVDNWTWDAPELKTLTSPDKSKRARADIKDGGIELKIGEPGGDHPVDLMIEHTEVIPAPAKGSITMRWLDNSQFVVTHPNLGTKVWTVENGLPMKVAVKSDWQPIATK